ncbi:MAG: aldehyde dehydrogenase family protein, partial [Myxococcales bacterium]|nr:aldehyde dehydrogenase family protein [Myxococcales bacterium]
MSNGAFHFPEPVNEPVLSYAPCSRERRELEAALPRVAKEQPEIPVRVGGAEHRGGAVSTVTMPHAHREVIAKVHHATGKHVEAAIDQALRAAPAWRAMSFADRAGIFMKAADLLAGPWRARVNAACMLGQSKTCYQSEIDAACEL